MLMGREYSSRATSRTLHSFAAYFSTHSLPYHLTLLTYNLTDVVTYLARLIAAAADTRTHAQHVAQLRAALRCMGCLMAVMLYDAMQYHVMPRNAPLHAGSRCARTRWSTHWLYSLAVLTALPSLARGRGGGHDPQRRGGPHARTGLGVKESWLDRGFGSGLGSGRGLGRGRGPEPELGLERARASARARARKGQGQSQS